MCVAMAQVGAGDEAVVLEFDDDLARNVGFLEAGAVRADGGVGVATHEFAVDVARRGDEGGVIAVGVGAASVVDGVGVVGGAMGDAGVKLPLRGLRFAVGSEAALEGGGVVLALRAWRASSSLRFEVFWGGGGVLAGGLGDVAFAVAGEALTRVVAVCCWVLAFLGARVGDAAVEVLVGGELLRVALSSVRPRAAAWVAAGGFVGRGGVLRGRLGDVGGAVAGQVLRRASSLWCWARVWLAVSRVVVGCGSGWSCIGS